MTYFCWWLVDLLLRLVDSGERDAVRGDLVECGSGGAEALREVIGLVVRRQAAMMTEWQSWLVLAGLVAPLAALLTLVSRRTADGNAIYLWLYANNWTWTYVSNAGFRQELLSHGAEIAISWVALICWSWTGGLLIGYLSRRTIWVSGAFLSFGLLAGAVLRPSPFIESFFLSRPDRNAADPNAAVFALAFYRVVFPFLLQCLLVLLPALAGIRRGARTGAFPLPFRWLLLTLAFASMTSLITQDSLWWQLRTWQSYPLRLPRLPSLHLLALAGPVGYMIVSNAAKISRRAA
jgi:hypothetical protein